MKRLQKTATLSLMRSLVALVVAPLLAAPLGCDDGAPTDTPEAGDNASITVTEVMGPFAYPESAVFDAEDNVWWVGSLGQEFGGEEQRAFITELNADGSVATERFIEVDGDILGVAADTDNIYAARGSDLLIIKKSDASLTTIPIDGAMLLNDVTLADSTVYVSDTFGNRVYSYTEGSDPVLVSEDQALMLPNGVIVDDGTVLVGTVGEFPPNPENPGHLYTLDRSGVATQVGDYAGFVDGIEKFGDDYLISDASGKLVKVSPEGRAEVLIDLAAAPYNFDGINDLGFRAETKTIFIPVLNESKLYKVQLP